MKFLLKALAYNFRKKATRGAVSKIVIKLTNQGLNLNFEVKIYDFKLQKNINFQETSLIGLPLL